MPADTPRKAHAAVDYLNALYQPDDRLAIVAVGRHGPEPKVEQRVVTARAATRPGYQRFLRHLNATGHDIFVSMNPIRPDTRSREKGDVLEVRRLQLDLDKNGPDSLKQVLADVNAGHLPAPAAVIRSSRQNYQIVWHTDPSAWTPETAEDTMRRLAGRYGGDSSVADVARVMRLPASATRSPSATTPRSSGPRTTAAPSGRNSSPTCRRRSRQRPPAATTERRTPPGANSPSPTGTGPT